MKAREPQSVAFHLLLEEELYSLSVFFFFFFFARRGKCLDDREKLACVMDHHKFSESDKVVQSEYVV